MTSAINANLPINFQPADKADLRNNLLAAKNEIEALQGTLAGLQPGTAAGDIVQLDDEGLPAVPAGNLTGLNASQISGLVTLFSQLADVGFPYAGNANKSVVVNVTEDGLTVATDTLLDPSGQVEDSFVGIQAGAYVLRTPTQVRDDLGLVISNQFVISAANATDQPVTMWPNVPVTLSSIRARTDAGAVSIVLKKNGVAMAGYASPVVLSTTPGATTNINALAQDDVITITKTSVSGAAWIYLTFLGVRT